MAKDRFLETLFGAGILAILYIQAAIVVGIIVLCIYGVKWLIRYFKRRKAANSLKQITSGLSDDIYVAPDIIEDYSQQEHVVNDAIYTSPYFLRLEKMGAKVQISESSISIDCNESTDIKDLLICASQINRNLSRNHYLIHLYIYDNSHNLLVNCIISSSMGRDRIWHSVSLSFTNQSNKEKDKKFEFYSDCVDYIYGTIFCHLKNQQISDAIKTWESILKNIRKINSNQGDLDSRLKSILELSDYSNLFSKKIEVCVENKCVIVEYELPSRDNFCLVKEYKYIASSNEISEKKFSDTYRTKFYESVLYSICLRSISEILAASLPEEVETISFNGHVTAINRSNGNSERKCILSILVTRDKFEEINLQEIEPKLCFKSLKGVSGAKLIDITPITPILTFNMNDKRFIESRHTKISEGTNLAEMDWGDFEQLVRELFELEFASKGGEVKVTQASRDGGVDAIAFDPDPIHGGKIVIQAKRYTHTVGVSAVRDLYGTVINEGANSGILITTADYGSDSFEFAKNKPIKLLNGGHLLAMLHKHGKAAHINITTARINNSKHDRITNSQD